MYKRQRYRVANGSSQWKALNDFAALHGGIAPYFDKTGALEIKRNRKASCVNIDEKTPVTALAYCDKRYGVIAEALVVDSKAGAKQRVKNEAFCDRGGTSRRVFYVPARSGRQTVSYTHLDVYKRQGMSVAVTHGEKKTQTKAFLQPVKRENGEEPFSVTPLGAVSDECWRYLGPAEVEIAMGDLVQSGAREYVVRAAAPFYTGEEIVYYWAMLHPKEEEA